MSDWTDGRIEQLKALWAEGYSCSQIARQLGGVSRCSVIGKANRLGLQARRVTGNGGWRALPGPKPSRLDLPPPPPIIEEPPLVLEDGRHVTTMMLSDSTCKWPCGDPAARDFHYCGFKPRLGGPYCEAHYSKAYAPQPKRRDSSKQHAEVARMERESGLRKSFA